MTAALIALLTASFIIFVIYFRYSIANYDSKVKNDRFNVRNHFPYELNFNADLKTNYTGEILLIVSYICSLVFFTLMLVKTTNSYQIVASISGIVLVVSLFFLSHLSLSYITKHIISVIVAMISFVMFNFSLFNYARQFYQYTLDTMYLIVLIISIIGLLFAIVFVLLPNLTFDVKLVEKVDENKVVKYVRPNFVISAFCEWILLFAVYILEILLLIIKIG